MKTVENELIGSESLLEQQAKVRPKKYWDEFSLAELIDSMRKWHSENRCVFKKYGYQKLLEKESLRYADLATLLEGRLIHNHSPNHFYEKPLIFMKPNADLAFASYEYLVMHLYPRIIGAYPTKYVSTANHLWAMYEYSLSAEWIYRQASLYPYKTKDSFLKYISHKISAEKRLIKSLPDNKLIESDTVEILLPFLDEVKTFTEHLKQEPKIPRIGKRLIAETQLLEKEINPTSYCRVFYRTIPIITKLLILKNKDRNLKQNYARYLDAWRIYHDAVRESPEFQIYYLASPEHEPLETRQGQEGKPTKPKKYHPSKRRGRPKGSFKHKC